MNIYAEKGTKVVCENTHQDVAKWGNNDNPEGVLTIGGEYTVESTEVHSQHTKVSLQEFPGKKFNSCHFK